MNLVLRLTFNGKDYTYRVLTKGVNKYSSEIKISLEGEEFTLVRNQKNEWHAAEVTVGDQPALLTAIVRNISLRYRL